MKRLGKRRLQEGYEDSISSPVEISVEGDLAVVKVDGQEVEAVKIEEGDDLIQVVEEIKADYMEGRKAHKGRRKLQEGMSTSTAKMIGTSIQEAIINNDVEDYRVLIDNLVSEGELRKADLMRMKATIKELYQVMDELV